MYALREQQQLRDKLGGLEGSAAGLERTWAARLADAEAAAAARLAEAQAELAALKAQQASASAGAVRTRPSHTKSLNPPGTCLRNTRCHLVALRLGGLGLMLLTARACRPLLITGILAAGQAGEGTG